MSKLTIALGIALAASLGANTWQALSEADAPARSPIKTTATTSGLGSASEEAPTIRRVEVCEQKLERCTLARRAGPLLFGSARRGQAAAASGHTVDEVEAEPTPFLCELARDQAASLWREKEAAIVVAMRQSLADPEIQARDVEVAVERFGDHLDLSQSDRESLASRYKEVRLKRIEQIRTQLADDPPDYAAIIRETKGLFAEEDSIAAELFGDDAASKLRDKELEARSGILSIAASLGELPWEENVVP